MRLVAISPLLLCATACVEPVDRDTDQPPTDPEVEIVEQVEATIPARPVRIGYDGPRFNACAGVGQVRRTTSGLPVKSSPSSSAPDVDELASGRRVSMCQQVGDWIGVVYAPDPENPIDCGTSSPVPNVRNYEGDCKSGWVDENYIKLVGG